jgi:hypothetical protein
MKPGEKATFFALEKDYEPVFYLQGRVIPGPILKPGERDIFYATEPKELLPLLKNGSVVVFVRPTDKPRLEEVPDVSVQLLGTHPKIHAYRLTLNKPAT